MDEELAGIVTSADEKGGGTDSAVEERSFVGGSAMWLSTPPPKVPDCKVCNGKLGFVAQIYAPVRGHRALHVFACDSHATEDGGWSVLRTQCSIEPVVDQEKKPTRDKWASADAWNSDSDDEDELTNTAESTQPKTVLSSTTGGRNVSWVSSRIAAEDEEEEEDGDQEMAQRAKAYLASDDELAASTRRFVEDALAGKVGDLTVSDQDEKYEAVPEAAVASVAFASRLRKHPTQVVRYAYGARPLLLGTDRRRSPPPPCACGSQRTFECDLLPTLIYYLGNDKMEDWSTVSIFSCSQSCCENSDEVAIVVS